MITAVQGIPPIIITQAEQPRLDNESEEKASLQRSPEAVANGNSASRSTATVASGNQTAGNEEVSQRKPQFDAMARKVEEVLGNNLVAQFSIDSDSKQLVLKLLNSDTKEVIRQVPTPEAVKIARMIAEITDTPEQGTVTDSRA